MKNAQNQKIAASAPFYAWTADKLAALFGVSESVIDGYADAGKLPRLGNGLYDGAWMFNLARGEQMAAGFESRTAVHTLVAMGWLFNLGEAPDQEDVDAGAAIFERNGLTPADFSAALAEARSLLNQQTAVTATEQ